MDFSEALKVIKGQRTLGSEGKVTRTGWNGKGQYLELQTVDEHSKMGLPYIYISTVDGKLVPWVASHTDLLADDWEKV